MVSTSEALTTEGAGDETEVAVISGDKVAVGGENKGDDVGEKGTPPSVGVTALGAGVAPSVTFAAVDEAVEAAAAGGEVGASGTGGKVSENIDSKTF